MSASVATERPNYPLNYQLITDESGERKLEVIWPIALEVDGVKTAFTRESGMPMKYALGPISRIVGVIPMTLSISEIRIEGARLSFLIENSHGTAIDDFIRRVQHLMNGFVVEVSHLHEMHDGCSCGDPGRPNHKVYPPKP